MSRKEFGVTTVDEEERRASRWLLIATVMTLTLGLLWAAYFQLDEVTRGQGKVIPVSREQIVQSLDTGVVTAILVREGSVVKRNDVLIRLDDARSGPVFRVKPKRKNSPCRRKLFDSGQKPMGIPWNLTAKFPKHWLHANVKPMPPAGSQCKRPWQVSKKRWRP